MNASEENVVTDLIVVGAGPTGIAIGAEAIRAGLSVELIDQGPLLANLLAFPTDMMFFTTREKLEIAGIPFAIPEPKPTRRQAVTYYHSVARAYGISVASYETVTAIEPTSDGFTVRSLTADGSHRTRRARAVAIATGYFHRPRRIGVPGEDEDWVHHRFTEPYPHFGERVIVVGGGNSAVEAAMELWRSGAEVTLVHRGAHVKPSVKYWLRPDFENRVAEGEIEARYGTRVLSFEGKAARLSDGETESVLEAEAAYVLIGYEPDMKLLEMSGVEVDPESLVPRISEESCESNVPGLYIAGTLQAGRDTNSIFIENSRVHGVQIVRHLASVLSR